MAPTFGDLRLESGKRVVTNMTILGRGFQVAFVRLPNGSVGEPILTWIGEGDQPLEEARKAAVEFRRVNRAAIDALLPKP